MNKRRRYLAKRRRAASVADYRRYLHVMGKPWRGSRHSLYLIVNDRFFHERQRQISDLYQP